MGATFFTGCFFVTREVREHHNHSSPKLGEVPKAERCVLLPYDRGGREGWSKLRSAASPSREVPKAERYVRLATPAYPSVALRQLP